MNTKGDYVDLLRAQYNPLLKEHGVSHRSVNWGSEGGQRRRFEVLLEALPKEPRSILDVGCGIGDLVAFLDEREYVGRYAGTDLLSEMVETAQRRFPSRSFTVSAVGAPLQGTYDLVVASGIMAYCSFDQLAGMVAAMFAVSTGAVAFNALSTWSSHRDDGDVYHDPVRTLEFCRSVTPWVTLRHDYMPHDFTAYLYREQQR